MLIVRSDSQNKFYRVVSSLKAVDESKLYRLFDLIQAPDALQSFFVHIPLLPNVFRAVIEIAELYGLDDAHYREAEQSAILLNTLMPEMIRNPRLDSFRANIKDPKTGPCKGLFSSHPLYSALAETVHSAERQRKFAYLKAHIIHSVEGIGRLDLKEFDALEEPFRCIRKLNTKDFVAFLDHLPDKAVTTGALIAAIMTKLPAALTPICRILERSEQAFRKKKRQNVSLRERGRTPDTNLVDGEDPAWDFVRGGRPTSSLSKEESETYVEHDGLLEELSGDLDLEPVLAEGLYHGPNRRQLALQAKQASNRRAINNQFCALAWNQANLFDLQVLINFLAGDTQLDDFDFQPLSRSEAAIVLALMLFSCNPLERVLSFPVFDGVHPMDGTPEGIYRLRDKVTLWLYTHGPDLASRDTQPSGTFPAERYVNIPMPEILCRCMEIVEKPAVKGMVRPQLIAGIVSGDEDSSAVYSMLRKLFGALRQASGARLSPARISSYLLHRVAEAEKCDLPGSMLYFGRTDKIAHTRKHYTLAPVKDLETAYRKCVNNLLGSVGAVGGFNNNETVVPGRYLGTPFCPLPKTVSDLSDKLKCDVSTSRECSFVERHNRYALYTAMLISYGTGFRAISDPSLKELEIDSDWGIGIIADKGNASYRSRYVYLAPVVLEQIRYYRMHMQVVFDRIGLMNPSLFNLVRDQDYEGLPLNLFLLEDNCMPITMLAPKVAEGKLKKHGYGVPLNAGRHYLKYRLLQEGCSPELAEAQLGHWENGQEVWGQYSNLDPLDFIMQLADYIPEIMEKNGWEAMKGLSDD